MNTALNHRSFIDQSNRVEVLNDYRLACESRHASLMGRKEVFAGKAKFGIFGDGKELPQLAMAKAFLKGDFRSGYYRDQTFMFAVEELTLKQYFAQLYAHTSIEADPATGGRSMNGHFSTRSLDEKGNWKNLMDIKNSSADISCTAGQMPRLVGLGLASKLYRQNPLLSTLTMFSNNGNEVAWGTIGNASTSEGHFWEALNAIGVMQLPVVMSVWDDNYGISVSQEYHTTKESISKIFEGFRRNEFEKGFEIIVARGWNYPELCQAYIYAGELARREHIPVFIHVTEVTQPQGHSTSGSHERYKSKERLDWEAEYDCLKQMALWLVKNGFASPEELQEIDKNAKQTANKAKNEAWKEFNDDMKADHESALQLLEEVALKTNKTNQIQHLKVELEKTLNPMRADAVKAIKKAIRLLRLEPQATKTKLVNWVERTTAENFERYSSHLYSQSAESALKIQEIKPIYDENSPLVDGREVLQACFDALLGRDDRVFAFGEDVGKIGDVNQAFAGLQAKYGELRVFDTSIREATIIGQGIGAAMRGLRPIAEIQYLDYLLYGLQTLSDDLACLHYRSAGGQKAPLIIRSRGHRLEGIWHAGSPMGVIVNALRGIYVLVPRNMTQAAGFYNTLMKSDDAALVIECLNGYRLKERIPNNVAEFTLPLGIPEVLKEGKDLTIVTYGSMCRIVMEAAAMLAETDIDAEVIDVQTLLPFDRYGLITKSLQKTNRVIFADEDVDGGGTAYMMQEVLDKQNAYQYLDSKPVCVAAKAHRPPYGSDGDYFAKPNPEEVFEAAYQMMSETNPSAFPPLY